MLLWDLRREEFETDVEELEAPRRRSLALASLDALLSDEREYFQVTLSKELKELVKDAAEALWNGTDSRNRAQMTERLDAQTKQNRKPGIYDLLMGMLTLLNCGPHPSPDETLESLSYFYQSVLDLEILSKLTADTAESEIRLMEEGNEACNRAIDEQLELLNATKWGEAIARRFVALK